MAFNKISALAALLAAVPFSLGASEVMVLPAGQGIIGAFGAVVSPQQATGNPLSGQYAIQMGPYTTLQFYDQGLLTWRNLNVQPGQVVTVSSDGTNYRLANSTGCAIGALTTNAGTGYTNGFYGYNQQLQAITILNGATTLGNTTLTVTPSAGGSLWNVIVGGAANTTIGVSGTLYQNQPFGATGASFTGSGGSNYTRPPLIVFSPPPNQGAQPYILPTAVCTISGGAINSVTVVNQGAGLQGLCGITVIPQLGDLTGGGAALGWTSGNSAMVGSGTITALYVASHGTAAVTAVPTLTFSPASTTAATVVMDFTVTSFTATTPGVGYVAAGAAWSGGYTAGSPVYANSFLDRGASIPVFPTVAVAATTGLPSFLAGQFTGVNIQAVPTISAFSTGAAASTAAVTTVNVGGTNDTLFLYSF